MNNWLLIIVATIFIVCIVVGYVRGFLKLGISLLSTVLTLVIVLFLSPLVADALSKYTPVDDYIETRIVEAFIPDITEDQLAQYDMSGTPLADLSQEQLQNLNELDWDLLGITVDDILNVIGEIPRDVQISEIENAPLPRFLKDQPSGKQQQRHLRGTRGTGFSALRCRLYGAARAAAHFLPRYIPAGDHYRKSADGGGEYHRRTAGPGTDKPIAGGALGLVLAVVIVWLGFLIMTLAYTTEAGMACFEMVEKSRVPSVPVQHQSAAAPSARFLKLAEILSFPQTALKR